jgi:hypothetical protein
MPDSKPHMPWEATRRGLADGLAGIDGLLPGSVVSRRMRCGKPSCACRNDPPTLHGPYIQWTRTVAGKTITRYLSTDQLARYQQWFDNARRLKEIVAKLEIASLHAVEQSEAAAPTAELPAP